MKKTSFYFDSRDKENKIHAVRYEPEAKDMPDGKPVAVLQIVHGMAEYFERYEETAAFFTGLGFVVTGEDHLGHGGSVPEGGIKGYICKQDPATVVVRDVHRLKKMTQEVYPGVPYFIMGHSFGSFITRNYMARYGTGIKGAILMGTGQHTQLQMSLARALAAEQRCVLGGEEKVSTLLSSLVFGSANKKIKNPKTENDWISRNEENVQRYNADELCGFPFTVNGYITLFELVSRCLDPDYLEKIPKELPVLLASGEMDPIGDYGAGVREVYESYLGAGIKNVTMKLYEGDRHEILNEDDRETIRQDLYNWIYQNLPEADA